MQITQLQQTKRDTERVSIFIDGKYSLALSKDDLVRYGLHVGKEVTETELNQWQQADIYYKLWHKIYGWYALRPRSFQEVKQKIRAINLKNAAVIPEPALIDFIYHKLLENGFNDEYFCRWWIEERQRQGKYGKQKIKAELMAKGISSTIIEKQLSEIFTDSEDVRKKVLLKKFGVEDVNEIKDFKLKSKAYRYLQSRGF